MVYNFFVELHLILGTGLFLFCFIGILAFFLLLFILFVCCSLLQYRFSLLVRGDELLNLYCSGVLSHDKAFLLGPKVCWEGNMIYLSSENSQTHHESRVQRILWIEGLDRSGRSFG